MTEPNRVAGVSHGEFSAIPSDGTIRFTNLFTFLLASMRIVLCYPVERRHYEQISAVVPTAELVDAGQQRIAEEIHRADVFCGHAKVPIDWEGVVGAGRLKWIQSSAAGLDHCLVPAVVESEIIVTSASGVLADQVAEHAMALVCGLMRSLPVFFRPSRPRSSFAVRRATCTIARWGSWGLVA